ncbi:MAG: YceI family protein [Burkholderiales bacterium]|nr:YceI family protein [Burkholderiales bacterium]
MNTFSFTLRTASLCVAAALLCVPVQAQQKLLPAQSEIAFTSKQMGVSVDGHFKKFDAQIAFDPARPDASKIAFAIDTASATLGAPESDAELPKPNWFNVPKFPQATFQSGTVRKTAPGKYEVAGKLSIKGNVRDVVVPVSLSQAGAITTASGVFAIKRLAFKIGENEWADTSMVADDVQVKFKLALTGVGSY